MFQRVEPKAGDFYRHFKNKLYQIIAVAIHSETREKLVIYQALYGEYKTYARPLDMFLSEVDKEKYPEVTAVYRFEKVRIEEHGVLTVIQEENSYPDLESVVQATEGFSKDLENEHINKIRNTTPHINSVSDVKVRSDEENGVNSILLDFLDAETYEEKLEIIYANKSKITNELINAMSASIDCTVEEGELEGRINSFLFCLKTLERFETKRFR